MCQTLIGIDYISHVWFLHQLVTCWLKCYNFAYNNLFSKLRPTEYDVCFISILAHQPLAGNITVCALRQSMASPRVSRINCALLNTHEVPDNTNALTCGSRRHIMQASSKWETLPHRRHRDSYHIKLNNGNSML